MTSSLQENEIIPIKLLRQKIRNYSKTNRDKARNLEQDLIRFGLGEIQAKVLQLDNLTTKDVTGLANRIKRRKSATSEDMFRLSHTFLQDVQNINAFLNIPGALHILIKELTGKESDRQICAIETLCNLSLGEQFGSEKIAHVAGSYLIIYLDSSEERLKRTCLWTVANILSAGGKGANTLIRMELFSKLWLLYTEKEEETRDGHQEDAAVCLQLIACNSENCLRSQHQQLIIDKMHEKVPSSLGSEYHLSIIFDSGALNSNIILTNDQISYLIKFSLVNFLHEFDTTAGRLRIIYAIRIVANLLSLYTESFNILNNQMTIYDTNLILILNKIFSFRNEVLNREVFWLVKNYTVGIDATDFLEYLQINSQSLSNITLSDVVMT